MTQKEIPKLYARYSERVSLNVAKYSLIFGDVLVFFLLLLASNYFVINSRLVFYRMSAGGSARDIMLSFDWHYILMAGFLFYLRAIGQYTKRNPIWDEIPKIFYAALTCCLFDLLLLSISSLGAMPQNKVVEVYTLSVIKWLLLVVFVALTRVSVKKLLTKTDIWPKPTVIIGTGENAKQTYLALSREKTLGFDLRYFIDIENEKNKNYPELKKIDLPVLALDRDATDFFKALGRPHVIVALEEEQFKKASSLIDLLTLRPNMVDIVPPVRGFALYGLDVSHIFGQEILLLRTRNNLARWFPRLFKRAFDLFATICLLIGLSPLFLVLVYLIRKDGGNAFFGHTRVGENGKPFACFKFRSMVVDAEKKLLDLLARDPEARAEWERDFKLKNDPRITAVGNFLRKTSLDELPQLFNVLLGEMSLVGPRPVVAAEIERYGDKAGYYHEVKPGMTGLWQISGRNDIDYSYRVRLDVWYIKNWSFWLDLVILLKTIPVVLGRKGAY